MLRRLGYFSETGFDGFPSLRQHISSAPDESEDRLVAYLDHGAVLAVASKVVEDPLDPAHAIVGELAMLTDGAWVWPSTLSYYVRRYHVRLPSSFAAHALQSGWRVSEGIDIERLAKEGYGD